MFKHLILSPDNLGRKYKKWLQVNHWARYKKSDKVTLAEIFTEDLYWGFKSGRVFIVRKNDFDQMHLNNRTRLNMYVRDDKGAFVWRELYAPFVQGCGPRPMSHFELNYVANKLCRGEGITVQNVSGIYHFVS